ncbi:MAG: fused MFS/spermidine synthase [Planctomycetes bacterium]|nr:fused MFS/spermidine synthase [Planctomycetota bacterium]
MHRDRAVTAWLLLGLALLAGCGSREDAGGGSVTSEEDLLVHEEHTAFSHVRIKDRGRVRSLCFVKDTGAEVTETSLDLDHPERLVVPYTRVMFASFFFQFPPKKCLIVGLGGGAMVRFLRHHFPDCRVDAVEIDPAVVQIAAEYFGTTPEERARIFTEDAFDYLARTDEKYDVIYMDAFLKPGEGNDSTGAPLHLKTVRFLKSLHARLEPGGVVAFNMMAGPAMARDLEAISRAFPSAYSLQVPKRTNLVAVGTLEEKHRPREELLRLGRRLDQEFAFGFSLAEVAEQCAALEALYRPGQH